MKKLLLFLSLSFLVTIYSYSQSMSSFFQEEGFAELAFCAHPTSTYESGDCRVYSSYVLVNIYYEGYTTKIKVYRSGGIFTQIEVLYDSDYWPPFSAIQLIKDVIIEASKQDEKSSRSLTEFETRIGKTLEDMTGEEMACAALTIGWMTY